MFVPSTSIPPFAPGKEDVPLKVPANAVPGAKYAPLGGAVERGGQEHAWQQCGGGTRP